jgi:uncharacterized protein YcbK (DUF882 family)
MFKIEMKKKALLFSCLVMMVLPSVLFGQRSNYNEDDVVVMRTQQTVSENIMKLLEEKNVDSALTFFKKNDAATKKSLQTIANAIQKFKSTYTLEVSPDAPDDVVNLCYCKYSANEGEDVVYKIVFQFGRFDKSYKAEKIIFK